MTSPEPDDIRPTSADPATDPRFGQRGGRLTTAQGVRLRDTDHSLTAGPRGPALLQDHHLREKITHFDHERIPERVVHARGAAAHGEFVATGAGERISRAAFLAAGERTPVFVRFSTVLGSRGSADTVRDTRGFATKFYTREGVYDLVGNNIPVFFIQDAIKFPDIIHAAKPHPDREIPQAQSAHDTFWDLVSLHTEGQYHTIWNMSDRALPRSYRMMQGFGIHTFRLTARDGATVLVKFHWRPRLGTHGQTWEEAQLTAGKDPDFHRRDLADAIDAGVFPEWDLAVQVMPDTPDQTFQGIDLLDPTKLVPEELAPLLVLGTMTLNRNPANYFAETEQVAFHPGHLVPGIDVTDDPLLLGRLFSYLDTQISRLGGPNFAQLPINRTHADVDDMLRDGMHQTVIHDGVAPYQPNSLDAGAPVASDVGDGAFLDSPAPVPGPVRERVTPVSFEDHFSQPRMFFRSLTPVEQRHIVDAYAFELGRCASPDVRRRQLEALARIDGGLCSAVAAELGEETPGAGSEPAEDPEPRPSLRMVGGTWPVAGRTVAVVAEEPSDEFSQARERIAGLGARALVVAPHGGRVGEVAVDRTWQTATSIEWDSVVVLTDRVPEQLARLLQESFRHAKPIALSAAATDAVRAAGVDTNAAGVVVGAPERTVPALAELLAEHRVWGRVVPN